MGFLDKWLRPQQHISMLQSQMAMQNARLAELDAQARWYSTQANDIGAKLLKKEAELATEIKRNRRREDDLVNQLVLLNGGRPVVTRIETPKPEPEQPEGLTAVQQGILRDRAAQYCEQQAHGEPVLAEELETVYQRMLEDPDKWLTD